MEDRNKDLPLVAAEILIELQQLKADNNRLFSLMIEESHKNTERMLEVFNRGFNMVQARIEQVDERLARVERKQGDKN